MVMVENPLDPAAEEERLDSPERPDPVDAVMLVERLSSTARKAASTAGDISLMGTTVRRWSPKSVIRTTVRGVHP
jgi:hypothetical protein